MIRYLLCLTALALAPPHPGAAQTPSAPERVRAAWGFDRSDLTPHPDVRFGVLANGMRYAIMRNTDPAGALSVRMRVDVGATAESDREQGFVHLLEHLIFHGSENLPENALLFMLPRDGLKRHTDFNAYTDYRQTVYRLDLAKSDARSRETAMTVMREIAGHLSFQPRIVSGVKSAVRQEIEARDLMRDRLVVEQDRFMLPGTPMARGPVAGSRESVARATPGALKRLYDLYYRPERTTLVVVGDVDPGAVESEIGARFGAWVARTAAPEPSRRPAVAVPRDGETRLFVHPDAATTVTIARVLPFEGGADSGGSRGNSFLERLGSEMLGRRLMRMTSAANAPFSEASAFVYDYYATARVASLDLKARSGDWRSTLQLGSAELRRALDEGFTQAELDEQLGITRRALAAAAAPRTSSALSDAIVESFDRGIVFTQPQDPAAAAAYVEAVKLDEVNRAFRAAWGPSPPLVFVSHHSKVPGGQAALGAVLAASSPWGRHVTD